MDAEKYITEHWIPNDIAPHLLFAKHQERLRRCAEYLPTDARTFADVGCACGHSTEIMTRHRPGAWTGIDFSRTAIENARPIFPAIRFEFQEIDEAWSPLGEFEGVVCSEVLEHVQNDQRFAENLIGLTRRTLVVTTPSRRVSDPGHLRVYTANALLRLFPNARIDHFAPFFYVVLEKNHGNPR